MANRIVSVHAEIYGMGIYAIMLPSSGFSVAHYVTDLDVSLTVLVIFRPQFHARSFCWLVLLA